MAARVMAEVVAPHPWARAACDEWYTSKCVGRVREHTDSWIGLDVVVQSSKHDKRPTQGAKHEPLPGEPLVQLLRIPLTPLVGDRLDHACVRFQWAASHTYVR